MQDMHFYQTSEFSRPQPHTPRTGRAGLMAGPDGYDLSRALWHDSGWAEVADLRRRLEDLTELRDLVRQLGRASGRGPKRRAPQEVRCPLLVCKLWEGHKASSWVAVGSVLPPV